MIERITKDIDLHYSPDDWGYYFHDYRKNATSQVFKSHSEAFAAFTTGRPEIEWR